MIYITLSIHVRIGDRNKTADGQHTPMKTKNCIMVDCPILIIFPPRILILIDRFPKQVYAMQKMEDVELDNERGWIIRRWKS